MGKMRTVVTGGAGFIGSHLLEHLIAMNARVTVIDNFSTGSLENLRPVMPSIELIVGELGDILCLKRISMADYSHVFHLEGNAYIPPSIENPTFDFQANLQNTLMLLEALRCTPNSPRLVNISSAAVYGNPIRLPIQESDPTVPISPYGVSKLAGERYVAVYSQIYGIKATSLRLFSVYGPRQRKQVVYDLIRKIYAKPTCLEVLGDGSQERDFTYVLDVVQAMMLAMTATPGQGEVYNVATGTTHSITELVTSCCAVCKWKPEIIYTGHVRPGDAQKWIVDITALKKFGFKPQTSLETGLTAICNWYDSSSK